MIATTWSVCYLGEYGTGRANSLHASLFDQDEARLCAALKIGEPAAYEQLLRTYGGRLLATARRLLANEEDAQDALQEGLLSAFQALARFEEQSRLYTWLHRIVVNAALMKLRQQRRRQERSIEELLPTFLEDGHQTTSAVEWRDEAVAECERAETRRFVWECIDKLPAAYRTVLVLRDIEEIDTEAAEALGTNSGTIKTRLHRARQALRAVLDPHFRGAPS